MARFLAGVASALLLVTAGFFLWTGLARRDAGVPPPPAAIATLTGGTPSVDAPAAADAPQATEKTREEKRFSRYDHNKDGKIDRDEYLLARHKNFAKLDTNGDGKLSFEEYAAKAEAKFDDRGRRSFGHARRGRVRDDAGGAQGEAAVRARCRGSKGGARGGRRRAGRRALTRLRSS